MASDSESAASGAQDDNQVASQTGDTGVQKELHALRTELHDLTAKIDTLQTILPDSKDYSEKHSTCRRLKRDVEVQTERNLDKKHIGFLKPLLCQAVYQSSRELNEGLQLLIQDVRETIPCTEDVWVGYQQGRRSEQQIVATLDGEIPDSLPTSINGFDVTYRSSGHVSDEAEQVAKEEKFDAHNLPDSVYKKLNECITKHAEGLLNSHTNLEIISASSLKSRKFGTLNHQLDPTPCIVLYVKVKGIIPIFEEAFPSSLDGFPVDVREGYYMPFSDPEAIKYHKHLLMGCKLETGPHAVGTLGGFVKLPGGSLGCLTCCHVALNDESIDTLKKDTQAFNDHIQSWKIDAYQPSRPLGTHHFGHVYKAVHRDGGQGVVGVDAALIQITDVDRYPTTGTFPKATSTEAGFSDARPMLFTSGNIFTEIGTNLRRCDVLKYGMETGHTIGHLRLNGTAVRRKYFTTATKNVQYRLYRQLEINSSQATRKFAYYGDSGAVVFMTIDGNDNDITAIGLLVGGTTYKTTIVTPIWEVLKALNLPPRLLAFGMTPGTVADQSLDVTQLGTKVTKLEKKVSELDEKLDKQGEDLRSGFAAVLERLNSSH